MIWRHGQILKNKPSRWTILKPQFYNYLVQQPENKIALQIASEKNRFSPPLWEVDFVYLPLSITSTEWLLIGIDLNTMWLTQYCFREFTNQEYHELVFPVLSKFQVYFAALLVNIGYWKTSGRQEKIFTIDATDDYRVRYQGSTHYNSGVQACMVMEHLVMGKQLNIPSHFQEMALKYRRSMAEKMYYFRCAADFNGIT